MQLQLADGGRWRYPHVLPLQRAAGNDSFSSDDYEMLVSAGRACVEQGDSARLEDIVKDEKNQVSWPLFGIVSVSSISRSAFED